MRLFAMLRERAGTDRVTVELAEGATVARRSRPSAAPRPGRADRADAGRDGGQPRVRHRGRSARAGRRAGADPAGERRRQRRSVHVRVTEEPLSVDGWRAWSRAGGRRDRHLPGHHARRRAARVRGLPRRWRRSGWRRSCAEAIERHGLEAAAAEHRVGTVPLGEASVAVAVVGRAPRRGVRGRARDHRPHQGGGADLEEGDRGRRGSAGSRAPAPEVMTDDPERAGLRALPSVEQLLQTEPLRSAAAHGLTGPGGGGRAARDRAPPRRDPGRQRRPRPTSARARRRRRPPALERARAHRGSAR